jgi:mono/diheme cytochrome c family protein
MRACQRSLIVVIAAALVAVGAVSAVWAASSAEWKAPADAKAMKNPRADKKADKQALAAAKKNIDTNCQSCHGSGKGDGPAAAALPPPKPADWTSAKVAAESDGELFWKITNGRGAMPPWKHLPDNDRWDIVNYIRTLQKKK